MPTIQELLGKKNPYIPPGTQIPGVSIYNNPAPTPISQNQQTLNSLMNFGRPQISQASTGQGGYYKDAQNNVFDTQGNHIDSPTFQRLGLNITQIPLKNAPGNQLASLVPSGGNPGTASENAALLAAQNAKESNVGLNALNQNPTLNVNQLDKTLNGTDNQTLTQLLQAIQQQGRNKPDYTQILDQARKQFGVPGLNDTVNSILGQLQSVNAQQRNLQFAPQINAMQGGGLLQQGVTNAQQDVLGGRTPQSFQNILNQQSLAEQGNLAQGALQRGEALAQGSLGAAQAQGQLGIQQGQLQLQQNLNPSQVALQQAQALQTGATAGYYQNLYGQLNGQTQTGQGGTNGTLPQFANAPNGQALSQLPPMLQGAVVQDMNGTGFISRDLIKNIPNGGLLAESLRGKLGIPILEDNQARGVQKIDSSIGAINILRGLVDNQLKGGTGGRIQDIVRAKINDIFQNNPELTALNRARTTAIQEIQGLAGDAPGLRLNMGEITTAASNLPTDSDNIETARKKMEVSIQMLENQREKLYTFGGGRNLSTRSNASLSTNQSFSNQGNDIFSIGWGGK